MSIPIEVARRIVELEPLPSALEWILEAARSSGNFRLDLVDLLEAMPEAASRVVATANAADRADLPRVERLDSAVARLGVVSALQIAFDQFWRRVRTSAGAYGLTKHDLWFHSHAACWIAGEVLRRRPRLEGLRLASLAALVHDVGKMVISAEHRSGAWRMVDLRHARQWTLPEAELAVFRCTHAEVGAEVARHWHLGEEVARAIAEHHLPEPSTAGPMTDLVRFADLVSASLGVGGGSAGLVFPHDAASARRLGIKAREYAQIRTAVSDAMALLSAVEPGRARIGPALSRQP